jgi:hypothetical protein
MQQTIPTTAKDSAKKHQTPPDGTKTGVTLKESELKKFASLQ